MRILLTILSLLIIGTSSGQILPLYSNFSKNLYQINPGFTGAKKYAFFNAHVRKQWSGVDGSPFTQQFVGHSSLNESNFGVGGHFFNDGMGILKSNGMSLAGAYHIPINKETKLGIGIQGSFTNFQLRMTSAKLHDANDPILVNGDGTSGLKFNLSSGLMLHREDYYLGYSFQHLIANTFQLNSTASNSFVTHHYFMGGMFSPLNYGLGIEPHFISAFIPTFPLYFDFRNTISYQEKYFFDLGYRLSNELIFGFGMELFDGFQFSYNYDLALSPIRAGTLGSHELNLSYKFYYNPMYKKEGSKYKWIKRGTRKTEKEKASIE